LTAALVVGGVAVGILGLIWLGSVLLILFAAALVAVYLDGAVDFAARRLHLPRLLAFLGVIALHVVGVGGLIWLIGPRLLEQIRVLFQRAPDVLAELEATVRAQTWGTRLLQWMPENGMDSSTAVSGLLGPLQGFFSSLMSGGAALVAILLIGAYLALDPGLYLRGALHLVPLRKRQQAQALQHALGRALRWWLVGRLLSMVAVGGLTGVALWIAGIPLPLALGLIAGVFAFVPLIGPITSVIPALLIALPLGWSHVLLVLAIYAGVQALEGNLITPLIQLRAVSLPPAVLLGAQLAMGVLFGLLGVLLSTPFTVAIIVCVQRLYVQDVLGDEVPVLGSQHTKPPKPAG
jgi:predicted PurR-regulated permease PerM